MDFASLEPLAGGWSGETFLGRAGDERTVVRIYARPGGRGDHAAEIDAALLRLVRGLVANLSHWTPEEKAGLRAVAAEAEDLLDTVDRRCLVHSDLNPKNLMLDPGSLEVTGLLDWEYAHAGHPFTDLGNLLRFDRQPAYVAAVLAAYEERRAVAPETALELARAADLWALADLASRRGANPVADRAHDLLRAVAAARNLHAVPAGWTVAGPPA